MSLPKPWYRKSKKAWYLQVARGVQKRLGKTKDEADRAYRAWLLEHGEQLPTAERKRLTVAEVAQEFLDHSKRRNDARTYDFYCYFIVPFVERFGAAPAATFPPLSFTRSFPDGRHLGHRLRLHRLRLPPRRNDCNDFPPTSAAGTRPAAACAYRTRRCSFAHPRTRPARRTLGARRRRSDPFVGRDQRHPEAHASRSRLIRSKIRANNFRGTATSAS